MSAVMKNATWHFLDMLIRKNGGPIPEALKKQLKRFVCGPQGQRHRYEETRGRMGSRGIGRRARRFDLSGLQKFDRGGVGDAKQTRHRLSAS